MRRALYIPPFGELADPRALADIAVRAEQVGWDGVFLWDHIQYPDPIDRIADSWTCLAAIATRTERIRIGALVTPLARRRPWVLARQAVTLDHLSQGRMVLGLSVGGDRNGEIAPFGDCGDMRERAAMLEDGLVLVDSLMRGGPIDHRGTHYTVQSKPFLPGPVQRPRIPIWLGGLWPNVRPLRRAARWDGVFPDGIDPAGVEQLRRWLSEWRLPDAGPFTVVARMPAGSDPAPWSEAGTDWLLSDVGPLMPTGEVGEMTSLASVSEAVDDL